MLEEARNNLRKAVMAWELGFHKTGNMLYKEVQALFNQVLDKTDK